MQEIICSYYKRKLLYECKNFCMCTLSWKAGSSKFPFWNFCSAWFYDWLHHVGISHTFNSWLMLTQLLQYVITSNDVFCAVGIVEYGQVNWLPAVSFCVFVSGVLSPPVAEPLGSWQTSSWQNFQLTRISRVTPGCSPAHPRRIVSHPHLARLR